MLPQLGINIGDYELNILQCKIGLFDREFLVLFGQGLLLIGYDTLFVGFVTLFFGLVSFVGDHNRLSCGNSPSSKRNYSCCNNEKASDGGRPRDPGIASAPTCQPFPMANGPCQNRFAANIASKIIRQLFATLIAISGLLLESFTANGLQVDRYTRLQFTWLDRIPMNHLNQCIHHAIGYKRRSARNQLIKNRSERIDIRTIRNSCRVSASLLRRHVTWCPHDSAILRYLVACIDFFGQSKVRYLGASFRIEENVCGFDVAMEDLVIVCVLHCIAKASDHISGWFGAPGLAF